MILLRFFPPFAEFESNVIVDVYTKRAKNKTIVRGNPNSFEHDRKPIKWHAASKNLSRRTSVFESHACWKSRDDLGRPVCRSAGRKNAIKIKNDRRQKKKKRLSISRRTATTTTDGHSFGRGDPRAAFHPPREVRRGISDVSRRPSTFSTTFHTSIYVAAVREIKALSLFCTREHIWRRVLGENDFSPLLPRNELEVPSSSGLKVL